MKTWIKVYHLFNWYFNLIILIEFQTTKIMNLTMDKISSNLKSINVKINDEKSNNRFESKV